ncbi:hypothetical protein KY385_01165 [Candidatus Parcubacteria bacterium]|nr:hypothetical protein [Candidatus Parcubacteria bacterium]
MYFNLTARAKICKTEQTGSVMLAIVIMFPFFLLVIASYMQLAVSNFQVSRKDMHRTHAQFAADAGADKALEFINTIDNWGGTGGQINLHDDDVKTTYEASVATPDADNKIVTVTGRAFHPNVLANTTPEASVKIEIKLRPVRAGNFSIVTGVGGLYMQNSAKVLGGDVFVNGELNMQNSAQIGQETKSVNLSVAHHNCPDPPDGTYPSACAAIDGEPITITNPAHIYGDVKANNQVSTAGMSNPGLDPANPVVDPEPLPPHERDDQIANVTSIKSGDPYYNDCDANATTRTWAGRIKIEGDVYIKKSCKVIIEGDVWITGRLTLQNSAQLVIKDGIALGSPNTVDPNRPTVMVDGSEGISLQQSASIVGNAGDVGAQMITYWSRATCSPDCPDVTGQDLYDTRGDRTIYLQNSASAPESILYARWSQAELSNGGNIGAIVGQTVRLSNSAAITFGASAGGSSTESWIIDSMRRTFN